MTTLAQPPQGVSTGPHLDNRRIAAALLDLVVPAGLAALAYVAGLSLTGGVLLVAIGWTLYYFFALESADGQTLGKRVMKLRVVSADGSPASMEQIAKRTLVRIVDGHIVGLIVMLASGERRQRLGDMVAGTVVTEAEAAPLVAATEPTEQSLPAEQSLPTGKRALKMPTLSMPSLRKSSAEPKRKRSRGLPKVSLSSLHKRSRTAAVPSPRRYADPGAAVPAPVQTKQRDPEPDPVTELDAFAPLVETHDAEEAQDGMYDAPEPEYDVQFEEELEAVWETEPVAVQHEEELEAVWETEPVTVQHETSHMDDDEHAEPAEAHLIIKPMESVSDMDLVMQDAEDRHPSSH